jgi:hypothetical protein
MRTELFSLVLMVSVSSCSREGSSETDAPKTVKFCGQEVSADARKVKCSSTKVKDLSPIQGLKKLEQLDLAGTRVKDTSPLKGVRALSAHPVGAAALAGAVALHLAMASGIAELSLVTVFISTALAATVLVANARLTAGVVGDVGALFGAFLADVNGAVNSVIAVVGAAGFGSGTA